MTAVLAVLALLEPVVVHDSREAPPLGSVGARPGKFAREPVVYERTAGRWRQWWLAFARNDHDRGIVRTGRHAGDWEVVQIRLDAAGDPVEAVFAQHSGAERCPWRAVETRGGRPVIYLANGSHAAYFRSGVRDRMWPDPNDEADERGPVVVPPVRPLGAWARWPGRWGGARAGWVPGEMDSPRGPRFQPQARWSDPEGWARRARPCRWAAATRAASATIARPPSPWAHRCSLRCCSRRGGGAGGRQRRLGSEAGEPAGARGITCQSGLTGTPESTLFPV